MVRVAYYGKGGIGKSTISSNVSGILGRAGKKVLHIGCDPKADSTRTLALCEIKPILQKMKDGEDLSLENLITKGKYGVYLAECGGPSAGVGCAGLGITTAMELLESEGVFEMEWDAIIYDVLGDVVCGGFAVPIKNHYVDYVNIVTSSDFMSLYAANNIIKAVEYYNDFDSLKCRLILNRCEDDSDCEILKIFSEYTKFGNFYTIKNSFDIKRADFNAKLLLDCDGDFENREEFEKLASDILDMSNLSSPKSMDAQVLEDFRRRINEIG